MRGRYNQIANFVLAQSEINIAIKDKRPEQYFREVVDQLHRRQDSVGGITSADDPRTNLRVHCLPE